MNRLVLALGVSLSVLLAGCGGTKSDEGSIDGALTSDDALSAGDSYLDFHEFQATKSGSVTISLSSNDFDTVLGVFTTSGTLIDSDDDSGPGTDSELTLSVSKGTRYEVRVTSIADFDTGGYTLTRTKGLEYLGSRSAGRSQTFPSIPVPPKSAAKDQ